MKATCQRCGKRFESKPIKFVKKTVQSRFCDNCQYRNLMDGLNLPTPPEMLDAFTKNPTLTDEEYRKSMANVK